MIYLKLLSAALFTASSVSLAAASPHLLPDRVYQAARERVDAGYYPAIVIAYVANGKAEVVAFGMAKKGVVADGDTVFEIGSITKTFTATLLAEAVQKGTVKLDEPLGNLLPGYSIPSRSEKQITLLDVATQFSGLPRLPTNFKPSNPADPYADYGPSQLKEFLSTYKLPRDPGASYEYSNLAFGILGFALAEHAHENYADLLRDQILLPLGMAMTDTATTPKLASHVAEGHNESGDVVSEWNFTSVDAGAGAIRSTGNDMLKYLRANMETAHGPLGQAMKFAQGPRRSLDGDARIGLAWMTQSVGTGHVHLVEHTGLTAGYFSDISFLEDGSRGIVILTNTASSTEELAVAALDGSSPLSKTQNHKAISLDNSTLDNYVGVYKLSDTATFTVSHVDDKVYAQTTGQGPFPIFPSARDEFFAKVDDISISFLRDSADDVAGLVIHQHGDTNARKLNGAEATQIAKGAVLEPHTMRDYLGRYQMGPGLVLDVSLKADQLYVGLTGQPALPIYAKSKDHFFYTVVPAQLEFKRDVKGAVNIVILHQGGQDHEGQIIRSPAE